MQRYYEYGNIHVPINEDDLLKIKYLEEPTMELLGFKPLHTLRHYYNLKIPILFGPNEQLITGSSILFHALINAMIKPQVR